LLNRWAQSLLYQSHNLAIRPAICLLQILSDPSLDILDLGVRIARRLLASVKLREANTEAHLIDISIRDNVVVRGRNGRVHQQLDQALSRQTPALGVPVNKGLGVGEGLCERHDGGFAVDGTGKLLGVREDDGEVDSFEDTELLISNR
jgi:hypothetical protein